MEAEDDRGELIFEEDPSIAGGFRGAVAVGLVGGWVCAILLAAVRIITIDHSVDLVIVGTAFLIVGVPSLATVAYMMVVFSPIRLYERGLTTHTGKFIPYKKLNRVHMIMGRPPSACRVMFRSLSIGLPVHLILTEKDVNAHKHIELVHKLEALGLLVSASKHPEAEDDGLVEMTRGELIFEEPPDVFSARRRRALIGSEALVFSPFLLAIVVIVYADLWADGALGSLTTLGGTSFLILGIVLGIAAFFILPLDTWRFYEKAIVHGSRSDPRYTARYEDCGFAEIRRRMLLETESLRVHVKGSGITVDIPVGEKKHAYGDVDRLVELLESKGVPVER